MHEHIADPMVLGGLGEGTAWGWWGDEKETLGAGKVMRGPNILSIPTSWLMQSAEGKSLPSPSDSHSVASLPCASLRVCVPACFLCWKIQHPLSLLGYNFLISRCLPQLRGRAQASFVLSNPAARRSHEAIL